MENSPNYVGYLWGGDIKVFYHWPGYTDVEVHNKNETETFATSSGEYCKSGHRGMHSLFQQKREAERGDGCWSPTALLTFTEWWCLAWRKDQIIDRLSGSLHYYPVFTFQLSHTPFPQPKLDCRATTVNYKCKLCLREAVDLTRQRFSKFWRTCYLDWKIFIGWGLILLLRILSLVVKLQLSSRRALTVTTDSSCPVWIGPDITVRSK